MFKLRPYQKEAVSKAIQAMMETDHHPLVAVPTGGGKTVIMAGVVKRLISRKKNAKILILSHVKEILEQDYKSLKFHLKIGIGLYSAGLSQKSVKQITVAGIQSVHRNLAAFSHFDYVIVDECHLMPLSGDGMYRTYFKSNPNAKYFGLTATPFRLGGGYIYGQGKVFTDVAYDLTSMDNFNKLIEDGYLCNLKIVSTKLKLNTTKVRTQGGDFANLDMSNAFDRTPITNAAVDEMIRVGGDRKKWLIFAIDIKHAEHIAERLIKKGISAMVVHSKMEFDRDLIIKAYKEGLYRAIVNVNVLTTGFDDPEIDLIGLLRPTKSPVIHVQTIGRGLRIAPGKDDCLIMDFAGNTERNGPINDIHVKEPGKKGSGEPITKTCPDCETIHHPAVRKCPHCGHEFQFKHNLQEESGRSEVVKTRKSRWAKVDDISYNIHNSNNAVKKPTICVTYQCGVNFYREWICVEHSGYAGHVARNWIQYRGGNFEQDIKKMLEQSSDWKIPNRVRIDNSGKYPVVTDYSF